MALLKGKLVRPGLSAKEYRRALAPADDGEEAIEELLDEDRQLPLPLPAPPAPAQRRRAPIADAEASSDDSSVVGGDRHVVASLAAPLPALVAPTGSARESGDDNSVAGGDEEVAQALALAVQPEQQTRRSSTGRPLFILGAKVSLVPGRVTLTHTYFDRLSVRCTNEEHTKCQKSRSTSLMRDRFGERAAEASLGAWLAKAGSLQQSEHTKFALKDADMAAYLAANP